MAVFPSSVRIEARLGNGVVWIEIPDVLITTPISISRGNEGSSQKDRVAQTGSMTFKLNNAEDNSGGLLGLYSPNNSNRLIGWEIGIPVRCVVTYNGTDYTLFVGVIDAIEPMSGKFRDRQVTVTCTDWMEEASRSKIRGLPLMIGERSSKVFETVAMGVERQPVGGYDIKPGADVFAYALDSSLEGETNAMSEFQRIAQSELGRVYVNREGTVVYEGRHYRPNLTTLFLTMDDDDIDGVEAGRGREAIINHAEIQVHPRRVDATPTTVLSELAGTKKIERETTVEVNVLLRDPEARATRVGGRDMVPPVPITDYLFNSLEDGTGTDLTAQLTVDVVFSANGGEATITNNGPQDGYLRKFQTRGRGVYDYETVYVKSDSQASKDKYGEAGFSLDMPYQANFGVAQDAADFVLQQSKEILTQIRAVRFYANNSDRLMLAALNGEISNKISLTETVIGADAFLLIGDDSGQTQQIQATKFFINSVRLEIGERGITTCTWAVEPGDPFAYWILEVPGSTELEQTTRLAYGSFQLAWVLDFDFLGTTTRLGDA